MNRAQNTANLPFNLPQAPVAGFSPTQQAAFNTINNLQGGYQPYLNQAQSYFQQGTQPNVSQFFNPYAGAVTAQLGNIFGQQQAQNNANLVQSAGGVGADRIAVGQANLANQQGLAAGQTLANLYQPALGAALQQENIQQGAGYGLAGLGAQSQNLGLQGAQAQLGAGGLQQQLSQAQLNAPYQWQVAQSQFPYQQTNFLAGITGGLAPGLGGTTSGYGQTTQPGPSLLSQILGGAGVGVSALGATGAFGSNGYLGGLGKGGGQPSYGQTYGGYDASGTSQGYGSMGGIQYPALARGGAVDDSNPYLLQGYQGGGEAVSDQPLDVRQIGAVPTANIPRAQAPIPQLNLNPPQQQSGGGGKGAGNIIGDMAKIAAMFKQGGAIRLPGYADGGSPDDASFADRFDANFPNLASPPTAPADEPYRMPDQAAVENWRRGTDADRALGQTAQATGPAPAAALGYAPADTTVAGLPGPVSRGVSAPGMPSPSLPLSTRSAATAAAPSTLPAAAIAPSGGGSKGSNFLNSPWAPLMAASLGVLGGSSPFAGVNIGQGAMAGLKLMQAQQASAQKEETIQQAAKRLEQEAQFHADTMKLQQLPYEQLTKAQQATEAETERYHTWEMTKPVPGGQSYDPQTGRLKTQYLQPETGPDGKVTYKPVTMDAGPATDANGQPIKGMPQQIGDAIISGKQMPYTTGLGQMAPQVRAYLASQGFDMSKAYLEAKQAEKQIQVLNGPQMTRGYQLYRSVDDTINEVRELSKQMQLGGVPFMNSLELQAYIKAQGNSANGQLATRYMTAVNTLKEEFANLANGGYAPTEPAWKLADQQVNGNYGMQQLGSSLDEIQRLIGYRMHFLANSPVGPATPNRYTGQQSETPAAPAAPAGKPTPTQGDIDYVKAHPEVRDKFIQRFGVEP